jgi:hypothetical protein
MGADSAVHSVQQEVLEKIAKRGWNFYRRTLGAGENAQESGGQLYK